MAKSMALVQRATAWLQGKGYGSHSVRREVAAAASLMDQKPTLVIDVGGNKGDYSGALRLKFPAAEIHIFEPALSNVTALQTRFASEANVVVNCCALGKQTGEAMLYADVDGSGTASLTRRRLDHFGVTLNHRESVKVLRFEDYWVETLRRRSIDFAKLDVEGHELDVIGGFGAALEHTRLVQFEFGGCNIDTRTYFQDFWYFFQEHGFEIHRITPFSVARLSAYSEIDEFFMTTNFLAKKKAT
jgi:FkbM family methyltransferase